MKTVLVILTQANLASLQVNESISASMVLATFGCEVKILLLDGALSLLKSNLAFEAVQHAFKVASNMVESFEFYDLTPLWVENKDQYHPFVEAADQDIEFIELDADLIRRFDHVLYW